MRSKTDLRPLIDELYGRSNKRGPPGTPGTPGPAGAPLIWLANSSAGDVDITSSDIDNPTPITSVTLTVPTTPVGLVAVVTYGYYFNETDTPSKSVGTLLDDVWASLIIDGATQDTVGTAIFATGIGGEPGNISRTFSVALASGSHTFALGGWWNNNPEGVTIVCPAFTGDFGGPLGGGQIMVQLVVPGS